MHRSSKLLLVPGSFLKERMIFIIMDIVNFFHREPKNFHSAV